MRRIVLAVLLLAVPAVLEAQQSGGGDPARRAQLQAQRDSLEREIVQRFMDDLTRELRLDGRQRGRMDRVLKVSGEQRRELMGESAALRGRLARALRDRNTTDEAFNLLLQEHEALRVREHDLWRREQDDLSRFLTPRQRTQFLIRWAHFQDQVRDIMEQRMRELRGQSRQDTSRQELPQPEPSREGSSKRL